MIESGSDDDVVIVGVAGPEHPVTAERVLSVLRGTYLHVTSVVCVSGGMPFHCHSCVNSIIS